MNRRKNKRRRSCKKRRHCKGKCPKCGDEKSLSRHHILPKRWFKCNEICLICRSCHNDLEFVIMTQETINSKTPVKLKKHRYYEILINFLI